MSKWCHNFLVTCSNQQLARNKIKTKHAKVCSERKRYYLCVQYTNKIEVYNYVTNNIENADGFSNRQTASGHTQPFPCSVVATR